MLNKRGQTQWEMTGWILALIVLVAIGLIVYYFMSASDDITENMIKKAEVIAQTCSASASESFVNTYCLQLREIDSKNFVTCDSLYSGKDKRYGVVIEGGDAMVSLCKDNEDALNNVIRNKCESLSESAKKKTNIIGISCENHLGVTCASLGGTWKKGVCDSKETSKVNEVTNELERKDYFVDNNWESDCCVPEAD
jgi:uncharacterized protein (UPF0333 family)